jgi:demethylmenaquinone methyltransferase / 2-methoxy-6-polyprenyl-1,4-benzoquinol methylase
LPRIGRLISKHTSAYTWLPESTIAFPEPPAFAARMRVHGFKDVRFELLMGGVCALYVGTKSTVNGKL